jgi:periplasmic divalent cation tolerance protein
MQVIYLTGTIPVSYFPKEGGRIMEASLLYITTQNNAEAKAIGTALLEERLIACITIVDNIQSMYWWNGSITSDTEAMCIAKTKTSLVPEVITKVKTIHSYTCPCVVALPIIDGNPEFLAWIARETR